MITDYYEHVEIPDLKPNLLFVDQLPSCRVLSINILRTKFDLIIYHDADISGFEVNSYDMINMSGFNSYVLATDRTGTGLMIKKEVDKGGLENALKLFIKDFMDEYPDCTKMELHEMDTR